MLQLMLLTIRLLVSRMSISLSIMAPPGSTLMVAERLFMLIMPGYIAPARLRMGFTPQEMELFMPTMSITTLGVIGARLLAGTIRLGIFTLQIP